MKHLSANSALQSSPRGSKSAARASRLAAKQVGVKANKHNGARHLTAPVGAKHRRTSPKARASRTPRLGLPTKGQLLIPKTPSTYVGRLSSVSDWHRQVGKVYREMRRHQIDPSLGTKLTFVANVGATLARVIEETMPDGIDTPQFDYERLDAAELQQLEALLAKAAGPRTQERITQVTSGETYDN
jgi:hypothetical protein